MTRALGTLRMQACIIRYWVFLSLWEIKNARVRNLGITTVSHETALLSLAFESWGVQILLIKQYSYSNPLHRAQLQTGSPSGTLGENKVHTNVYTLYSSLSNRGLLIRMYIDYTQYWRTLCFAIFCNVRGNPKPLTWGHANVSACEPVTWCLRRRKPIRMSAFTLWWYVKLPRWPNFCSKCL